MPSFNTYHLTWVSLILEVGISSQLLQKSTASAAYLGRVAPPDLLRGLAPLGRRSLDMELLLLASAADLQCVVAPLGPHP